MCWFKDLEIFVIGTCVKAINTKRKSGDSGYFHVKIKDCCVTESVKLREN